MITPEHIEITERLISEGRTLEAIGFLKGKTVIGDELRINLTLLESKHNSASRESNIGLLTREEYTVY